MVIQNTDNSTSSQYEVPTRRKPANGSSGLVSSRVQFFENPPPARKNPPPVPPKHAVLPAVSRNAALPHQYLITVGPPSHDTTIHADTTAPRPKPSPPLPPPPLEHRRRYPDSFSNDLPMIDESRQEDFAGGRSSSTKRNGSPLMETGIEHYSRGEYILAEKAFMTALKTQHANVGVDDLTIALIMGNLGAVYLKQQKVEQAMQFLETSLGMKKKHGDRVSMADTYNNLGNCANLLGKFDESLEYYRLALRELRQKQGRKSDVADALFNIGRLEIHRENFKTANGVLHEALRMATDAYGDNHAYVAEASDLLGFVQVSLGHHDEALVSFTKGLEVYRNLHGPLHIDVANAIFNIGMLRESKKDFSEAWEAYSTAQDLYRRLGTPPEDSAYQTVRRSIAHVEKLIAQQNQARLIEKHHEAQKKKKKQKERRNRSGQEYPNSMAV